MKEKKDSAGGGGSLPSRLGLHHGLPTVQPLEVHERDAARGAGPREGSQFCHRTNSKKGTWSLDGNAAIRSYSTYWHCSGSGFGSRSRSGSERNSHGSGSSFLFCTIIQSSINFYPFITKIFTTMLFIFFTSDSYNKLKIFFVAGNIETFFYIELVSCRETTRLLRFST